MSGDPKNVQVAVDAAGAVNPPFGRGRPPGGGPGGPGGGPGSAPAEPGGTAAGGGPGMGPGGPPGGQDGPPGGPPKANATIHIAARYVNGAFVRADSTETLSFERPDGTMTINRAWVVERTGS